jgi:hypothetical protein
MNGITAHAEHPGERDSLALLLEAAQAAATRGVLKANQAVEIKEGLFNKIK